MYYSYYSYNSINIAHPISIHQVVTNRMSKFKGKNNSLYQDLTPNYGDKIYCLYILIDLIFLKKECIYTIVRNLMLMK